MTEWSHKLKISEENASLISYIKSSLKMAYCDDIKNSKISKATKVSCVFEIRKLKPISISSWQQNFCIQHYLSFYIFNNSTEKIIIFIK